MENVNSVYKVLESFDEKIKMLRIGTYDGVRRDPVHLFCVDYPSRIEYCIFVEPHKKYFEKLKVNYNEIKFEKIFINKAIYFYDGSINMYVPKNRYNQSSVLPEKINKNKKSVKVDCITIKTLLKESNKKDINFVNIDVEGFDDKVIEQIFKEELYPFVINFEHVHLDSDEIYNTLEAYGYRLNFWGSDCLACKQI